MMLIVWLRFRVPEIVPVLGAGAKFAIAGRVNRADTAMAIIIDKAFNIVVFLSIRSDVKFKF